ncbi:hypothetical protein A4A49_08152 [Nicotiana attenuata]|uniref:Uncharacterized protein n=1 Tax=Nicotiana attenuata TaxID=49451 RepID=A0A1J6IPT5_NICAT|nr:hypothetical protein A4A49_08152 [Nicotiana attenuata]
MKPAVAIYNLGRNQFQNSRTDIRLASQGSISGLVFPRYKIDQHPQLNFKESNSRSTKLISITVTNPKRTDGISAQTTKPKLGSSVQDSENQKLKLFKTELNQLLNGFFKCRLQMFNN